jgi:hypothetical protein
MRIFSLIESFSSFIVIVFWFSRHDVLIFEFIDLSTISKISRYERNHVDWKIVERLDTKSTYWWKIDDSNRFKSVNANRDRVVSTWRMQWWDQLISQLINQMIKLFFFSEKNNSRHDCLISSYHLIVSSQHRYIYSSFNILFQSSSSMLRLISSHWSKDEWCWSDAIVSRTSHASVEKELWWTRLLTSLQLKFS